MTYSITDKPRKIEPEEIAILKAEVRRRMCIRYGFIVRNNHALRMSLNSNVLLPLDISVADRAAMLGHSIETNLKYYSFARKGYLEDVRNRLNTGFAAPEVSRDTSGTPEIVPFSQKRKPRTTEKSMFLSPQMQCGKWDFHRQLRCLSGRPSARTCHRHLRFRHCFAVPPSAFKPHFPHKKNPVI